jgi:hypothetical protein
MDVSDSESIREIWLRPRSASWSAIIRGSVQLMARLGVVMDWVIWLAGGQVA